MIVILAFITLIAILDSSEWQNLFLTLSLIGIVFINAFNVRIKYKIILLQLRLLQVSCTSPSHCFPLFSAGCVIFLVLVPLSHGLLQVDQEAHVQSISAMLRNNNKSLNIYL